MRLPIKALKELGNKYNYDVVVTYAWDAKNQMQHIATWGRTIKLCDQAAQWGNMMKDVLGWPEKLHGTPNRVKKLQEREKYWQEVAGKLADIANRMYEHVDEHKLTETEVDEVHEMHEYIHQYLDFDEEVW